MLPHENLGWESLVKALAQFYFCCSGARAGTMNDTSSRRPRASKMLMVPSLWARHGARHGWMRHGCALGEASQFSGTLHNLEELGEDKRGQKTLGSISRIICKWHKKPTVLGCQLLKKTESQHWSQSEFLKQSQLSQVTWGRAVDCQSKKI